MNVDHFFAIGQRHVKQGTPCEDYALSAQMNSTLSYGVISDGCSGADANTDIGARAISWAMAKCIENRAALGAGEWFGPSFLPELQDAFIKNRISPSHADYQASVVAFVSTAEDANLFFFGDGAYLVKFRDGTYKITWFEFDGNVPYYLAYTAAPAAESRFRRDIIGREAQAVLECWTTFQIDAQGNLTLLEEASRYLPFSSFDHGHVVTLKPAEQNIELLAVLSDGITNFTNNEIYTVVRECFAFKNYAGSFVKRRMIRALETLAKTDSIAKDDVAVSCVYYGATPHVN